MYPVKAVLSDADRALLGLHQHHIKQSAQDLTRALEESKGPHTPMSAHLPITPQGVLRIAHCHRATDCATFVDLPWLFSLASVTCTGSLEELATAA